MENDSIVTGHEGSTLLKRVCGGEGGGGTNVSCQLNFRHFVSCQSNDY